MSSTVQLKREVIKLEPTNSLRKLLKDNKQKQQPIKITRPKYNTNPLKILKLINIHKKVKIDKSKAINPHSNIVKSRNFKTTKYETCIVKDYIRPIEDKDSEDSIDCNTVIEHACDNNYSLICNSINELFT